MAGKGGSLGKNGAMKAAKLSVVRLVRSNGPGRKADKVMFTLEKGSKRAFMSSNNGESGTMSRGEARSRIKAATSPAGGFKVKNLRSRKASK